MSWKCSCHFSFSVWTYGNTTIILSYQLLIILNMCKKSIRNDPHVIYVCTAFPWLWFCFVHIAWKYSFQVIYNTYQLIWNRLSDLISLGYVLKWTTDRVNILEGNWWSEAVLECVLGFGFMFNVLILCGDSLINMNWLPLSAWPWTLFSQCSVRSDCTQWEWLTTMNEKQ